MTDTAKEIVWTNSRGETITATIAIVTIREIDADGYKIATPCCTWSESVRRGNQTVGYDILGIAPVIANGVMVTGRCGNVGIPAEQMDAIEAARNELRSTPEWQAREVKRAKAEAEVAEYEQHNAAVERMMTLDGRTY